MEEFQNQDIAVLENTQEEFQNQGIAALENTQEEIVESVENTNATNCLALTVVKDYKLTVFKNIFKKSYKVSWKIVLSIITINFLNTFL